MLCQKEKFSLSEGVCYLNGAYMSPLLKEVEEAGIAGLLKKRNPFHFEKSDFFEAVINLKKSYADILNVSNWQQISIVPSASYGLAGAAKNIKIQGKKNIIVVGEQFPSNYYVWDAMARKNNLTIKVIKAPADYERRGEMWNDRILEAIDEDTLLLAIAHVHWADGTLFSLHEFNQKLKKTDGLLIIDGTQSLGILPFNQEEIRADVIVAASYKWLLGPYSIGLAYYSDYFTDGDPIEYSWLNRQDSEDFSNLVNYQDKYKADAHRYDMGEAPNFISVPMATRAAEQILEWGPANCQSYCEEITEAAIRKLRHEGYIIEERPFRAAHLFGIRIPPAMRLESVKAALEAEKIYVSYRGDAIRVSPSVYNSADEMQRLANVLSALTS